jgi:hypothetical protein
LGKKAVLITMSAILIKSFVGQAGAYFEKELTSERLKITTKRLWHIRIN